MRNHARIHKNPLSTREFCLAFKQGFRELNDSFNFDIGKIYRILKTSLRETYVSSELTKIQARVTH